MKYPTASRPQPQGVGYECPPDTGDIPEPMLEDLRHLLWRMEKVTQYWAVAMAIALGGVLIGGSVVFASSGAHGWRGNSAAIGELALAIVTAVAYSPFLKIYDDDRLEGETAT